MRYIFHSPRLTERVEAIACTKIVNFLKCSPTLHGKILSRLLITILQNRKGFRFDIERKIPDSQLRPSFSHAKRDTEHSAT